MLTCFTPEHPVRGIADMADELGLGRSTTYRYATTLAALGYLEQGASRKYRLSSRAYDVGLSLLDSMVVRRVAREHVRELRAQTGHTASLGVLGETEVVYIDRWQGSRRGQHAVDASIGVGKRVPLHCTAAGKVLLALLPAAEQEEIMRQLPLTKRGPRTIADRTVLRAQFEQIVAEGVAIENEEWLAGRCAIAAVVMNTEGPPAAAVELAIPADAYTPKELGQLESQVVAAARRISSGLNR